LVSSGAIDVTSLISHRFMLEEASQAFLTASNPEKKAIKVMINCNN